MDKYELRVKERKERAKTLKETGSIEKAIAQGKLDQFADITLNEALALGLYNQDVKKYIGIFGHGSTDLGEVLRIYEEEGLVKVYNVRNEVEASHIAAALKWQYGETAAVFTSIGPGALQALAASIMPLSNGIGVYYIFGDETTQKEGPNMQQIPSEMQESFLRITSAMGKSYTLHTPEAIFTALKRGTNAVFNNQQPHPFYFLLPMNIQGKVMNGCNLLELPVIPAIQINIPAGDEVYEKAIQMIARYDKITVKIGNGARNTGQEIMSEFLEHTDAVFVHGPVIPGVLPGNHPRNMTVGGSKGSISGNYAMENCELLIAIGARGVCQWDSSGTSWKKVKEVININTRAEDAGHYNRTLPLVGDASSILSAILKLMKEKGIKKSTVNNSEWLQSCVNKRLEWENFKNLRWNTPVLYDEKWAREVLTQPAAIKTVADFANDRHAIKFFDAGDVQANGFQIVEDDKPGNTFTDNGASYMGFASSAILASAIADKPAYPVAFTGDGSFIMNPQPLIDAVNLGLKGMIVIFDNRRMAAISGLQRAQYGHDYKTDDNIEIDFVKLAEAVKGARGFFGGYSTGELKNILTEAFAYQGISVIHVPVYYGENELGGMGVFGNWNVGNWCEDVQKEKHRIGL